MLKHSLCSIIVCCIAFAGTALGVSVQVTGKADAEAPTAREQALADALREAVRQGTGVDVVSETQMTDFALDYDRAFSKARGYLKKYDVLSSGVTADGFYSVTIKAEVGDAPLTKDDTLTFQMMAREHQAPRVAIRINEQIEGAQNGTPAADWLKATAAKCGLRVVDLDRAQGNGGFLAKRAQNLGREQEAQQRAEGIVSACDYLIEGEVEGSNAGKASFYGSKAMQNYSLTMTVRVIDAATGNVLLSENQPARDIRIKDVSSDTAAAREAVRQLMEGSPRIEHSDLGWRVIRSLFACWASELDLGAVMKLEFTGMDVAKADALKNALEGKSGLGAVWIRSVDPVGISVIDCESRLDATNLAKLVEASLPGYKLDRSEKRYLSFRAGAAANQQPATPAAANAAPPAAAAVGPAETADNSSSIIIAMGCAMLGLCGVVVALILKKK